MNKPVIIVLLLTTLFIFGCGAAVVDIGNQTYPASEDQTEPVVETTPSAVEEDTIEVEETVVEELEERTPKPAVNEVSLIDGGFEVPTITINAGEAVLWINEREGRFQQAMIIGTKECSKIKSPIFNPGESFKWTFTEPLTCTIVDGIYTTQTMKVVVK